MGELFVFDCHFTFMYFETYEWANYLCLIVILLSCILRHMNGRPIYV